MERNQAKMVLRHIYKVPKDMVGKMIEEMKQRFEKAGNSGS